MKELQKYYALPDLVHVHRPSCDANGCSQFYIASEADAAFAEMRHRHQSALLEIERLNNDNEDLERKHAEEIERLKTDYAKCVHSIDEARHLMKQAGRYEKLRKLNPQQFLELWKTNLMGPRFDDLVDQLPASGEASVNQAVLRESVAKKTLLDFGYAPGNYMSTCWKCEARMDDVDKRCRVCKPCAEKALQSWIDGQASADEQARRTE